MARKKVIVIEGELKKLINLIQLGCKIHNKFEALLFLYKDLIYYCEKYNQKEVCKLLEINEPNFTIIMKMIKASIAFNIDIPKEFDVLYNNDRYTLIAKVDNE